MRLAIDLRFGEPPLPPTPGERLLSLDQFAALVRAPRELAGLLWGRRWDEVRVVEDGRPLSGVQAGATVLAALARARRRVRARPDGERRLSLAAAAARAAIAVPRELADTARLRRRAARIAATEHDLPPARAGVRSVAYLRPEPTLRWLGAHVGGAATHTAGVINGLVANDVDVHVYAPERPAGTDGVPFTQVQPRRVMHLAHWLTLVDLSADVVAAAEGRPVDAVYQRYALGSHAGLALARRLGVPLVLEFNGSEIWTARHWGAGRVPLAETLGALEWRNVADASLVVVVSDVLKQQLVDEGIAAERVLVNPNGVDVESLAPLRARPPAAWRAELGLPDAPTVGFVGTFGLWHGVKLLPAMVEALASQRPDARWVMVGDGPLHAEVRGELAARGVLDRVLLAGIVDHERAVRLLAAADVCVSPHVPNPDGSRFFGSPTKLFEYMGLGKAIVASDLEQIGEVLDDGRTALLHAPGDVDASAGLVAGALGDDALRERLGAAALAEAQAGYSWTAHVRRILDALEGG